MSEIKKLFKNSAADTIVACATILQAAADHRAVIENYDSSFSKDFFPAMESRINMAVEMLGAKSIKELLDASAVLRQYHDTAWEALRIVKTQIEIKYKKDKAYMSRLMDILGFKQYYTKASRNNQEAMLRLLATFKKNLTDELRTEFIALGISEQRLLTITEISENYHNANVKQETAKGRGKELTAEAVQMINNIYSDMMDLCKIARIVFSDKPEIRDRFTYSKVVKAVGAPLSGNTGNNEVSKDSKS